MPNNSADNYITAKQSSLRVKRYCISICGGTGCHAYKCEKVSEAFVEEIKRRQVEADIEVKTTGCHGFCERGPIVVIYPDHTFYQRVKPEDASLVIESLLNGKKVVEHLLYVDPITQERVTSVDEVSFYKKQCRLILGNNGKVDPEKIEDYLAVDGYNALRSVLFGMAPKAVVDEMKKSGLRGRGGAGFLTGQKWEICRRADGETKYIVCNADEGDPGAYMDRSVLEGNPHSVLEGMAIGAYAIGAEEGIVYVRTEYPLAIKNLRTAIKQAQQANFLGDDILGSGFNFSVRICQGAGAFVCGEETALIASIEGERSPEPRVRPPYPAESGLWGHPTNINNVETWASVPLIINRGAAWYAAIGTEKSKGTKIFSLVGKVNNTGLVEVPMGIALREIIYDIGGGIPHNKKFKAVQTGGPSGGCVPASLLDLPVDYESLTAVGSMMGSGGMVVMDEDTCMVDVAKYFLNFLKDESCGKCTSCREGIAQMYDIVLRITQGKGQDDDIVLLESLGQIVQAASMCGFGQTAANPVVSTIRYFRDEYKAHIQERRCPALVCKDLISYTIDPERCGGCVVCAKACPCGAIIGEPKKVHKIDQKKCIKCGICHTSCPPKFRAVSIVSPVIS
ncbi:MAG: NADH-quinone oxidoreductase subunit NuoF [candidate division WOR-3 bacterium]|nr:NADH-quinone oxidoreductase subunit NuoF [candidate division WOR-3 bacterium]